MNALSLLRDLEARGVRLEAREGWLSYEAPAGVLTPALLDELRARKQELLALLAAEEPPSLEEERALAAAWRGAVRELGDLAGYPRLTYKPGHAVAPGAINWGRFVVRASVPELRLVVGAVREYLATMPRPDGAA